MKKMSKKGITIVEIVVVIIILILLAVIAIFNTNRTMEMAQAMAYKEEFAALYSALTNLQTQYNLGFIEYTSGENYYSSFVNHEDNDNTWYTIYGLNNVSEVGYSEKIIKNLGLDELKRSYEFRLRDDYNNKDDIQIKLLGDDYLDVKGYRIRTYDDILELMESGAI